VHWNARRMRIFPFGAALGAPGRAFRLLSVRWGQFFGGLADVVCETTMGCGDDRFDQAHGRGREGRAEAAA